MKLTTFQATILLSLAYNSHGMGECRSWVRGVYQYTSGQPAPPPPPPFQKDMRICGTLNADAGRVRLLNHVLDKIGDIFIRHAVSMARKMGLFTPGPALKNNRTQRARDFTAWAFFNFQT